jgi:peptidoglycan hydrolase-like protein with peptidoglycan-binding domain
MRASLPVRRQKDNEHGRLATRYDGPRSAPAPVPPQRQPGGTSSAPRRRPFGALTRAAVVALQQQKRLTVDGEVGSDTWKALEAHPLAPTVDEYRVGRQEMLANLTRRDEQNGLAV